MTGHKKVGMEDKLGIPTYQGMLIYGTLSVWLTKKKRFDQKEKVRGLEAFGLPAGPKFRAVARKGEAPCRLCRIVLTGLIVSTGRIVLTGWIVLTGRIVLTVGDPTLMSSPDV